MTALSTISQPSSSPTARRSAKPLRPNPFVTCRDPATGRWSVVRPPTKAASS
ncbi:MAG: hypothetical protein ACFB8W_12355 [Elainellaceae cyanobacterium]